MENKSIVVLTGSFNPITQAHVDVLSQAVDIVGAERGLFVTTSEENLLRKTIVKAKTRTPFHLPGDIRRAMIEAISQEYPKLGYGGAEDKNPVGTTARMLKRLAKEYGGYEIYYICGADKLREIPRWDGVDAMLTQVKVLVFRRDDVDVDALLDTDPFWSAHADRVKVCALATSAAEISSTEVRRLFMAGEDYRSLMPDGAYAILSRLTPADFPPLTVQEIIEATIRYDGRFGASTARGMVYKDNRNMFRTWDDALLEDRSAHLAAKLYRIPFVTCRSARYQTATDCVNADCVDVAEQLQAEGFNPAILNLADNVHPCGGYHEGLTAQEESLCYVSTLSQVLYQYGDPREQCVRDAGVPHVETAYPIDRNYGGIYAPTVRFFRENEAKYYRLREHPFDCAVVSVASLANRAQMTDDSESVFFHADGRMTDQGIEIEKNKIRTIYRIALDNGHDSIVLGALGCGVYRLLPEEVSRLFAEVVEEDEFQGAFRKLIFAIYEGKGSKRRPVGIDGYFSPFYRKFGNK